jgi:hypothetical protein
MFVRSWKEFDEQKRISILPECVEPFGETGNATLELEVRHE